MAIQFSYHQENVNSFNSAPKQRDGLIKPNIENLKQDESVFFQNIINYFQNRPDGLEGISLAQFAAYYEYFKKNIEKGKDDNLKQMIT